MDYNIDYFIQKFEAIPEEKWCVQAFIDSRNNSRCAMGHCVLEDDHVLRKGILSLYSYPEAQALIDIFGSFKKVTKVNDGEVREYMQYTPKQRILAYLYDKKAAEAVKQAEAIIQNPVEVYAV